MKLTPEQTKAIDLSRTGESLRVDAYAGCGKTSTLVEIAAANDREGVYMAFNKAIAEEAKRKFPGAVTCSTTHSMAFRSVVRRFKPEKMTGSLNAGYVAKLMNTRPKSLHPMVDVTARGWAFLMSEMVKRYMRSGSDEIGPRHCPRDGAMGILYEIDENAFWEVARDLKNDAVNLWARMTDPNDPMPLSHDGYLKVWALGRPQIPGDYIMLDEAQDTNGVVMELMRHQDAQLITVGDRHQAIYEWRGARNAMTELPTYHEARLTTSWRFGPQIARQASQLLEILGEKIPLTGNPERVSEVGEVPSPDTILCRTNAVLIEQIIHCIDEDKRPHVCGGVGDVISMLNAAEKLQRSITVEHPDFIGFHNWDEVVEASQKVEGKDLQRSVQLVEKYGVQYLRGVLQSLPRDEREGDLTLTTGHKSKGREWASVRLADDFLRGVDVEDEDGKPKVKGDVPAETRLLYVAATRGMDRIEIPASIQAKVRRIQSAMGIGVAVAA